MHGPFCRQVTVEGIAAKGDILINSNHEVQETRAKLDSLSAMWTELKAMSDKIRRELQDALDMYNLQSAIDAIQSVVREISKGNYTYKYFHEALLLSIIQLAGPGEEDF